MFGLSAKPAHIIIMTAKLSWTMVSCMWILLPWKITTPLLTRLEGRVWSTTDRSVWWNGCSDSICIHQCLVSSLNLTGEGVLPEQMKKARVRNSEIHVGWIREDGEHDMVETVNCCQS